MRQPPAADTVQASIVEEAFRFNTFKKFSDVFSMPIKNSDRQLIKIENWPARCCTPFKMEIRLERYIKVKVTTKLLRHFLNSISTVVSRAPFELRRDNVYNNNSHSPNCKVDYFSSYKWCGARETLIVPRISVPITKFESTHT